MVVTFDVRDLCRYLSSARTSNFQRFGKRVQHLYKSVRCMEKQLQTILKLVSLVASRNVVFFFFLSRANTCQKHNKKGRKTRSHNIRQEKTKQGTQPLHRSSFCFENVSLTSPVFRLLSNRIQYLKTFANDEKLWT